MGELRPGAGKRAKALAGSYWNSNNPSLTKSRVHYSEGHCEAKSLRSSAQMGGVTLPFGR